MSKDTITPAGLAALTRSAGGKYGAKRTYVPELERWFASAYEAEVAVGLWRRQQAGEVRKLRFQVPFPLRVGEVLVCTYVADFVYEESSYRQGGLSTRDLRTVVADAKGVRTPVFKLKKRLMAAVYRVEIVEL